MMKAAQRKVESKGTASCGDDDLDFLIEVVQKRSEEARATIDTSTGTSTQPKQGEERTDCDLPVSKKTTNKKPEGDVTEPLKVSAGVLVTGAAINSKSDALPSQMDDCHSKGGTGRKSDQSSNLLHRILEESHTNGEWIQNLEDQEEGGANTTILARRSRLNNLVAPGAYAYSPGGLDSPNTSLDYGSVTSPEIATEDEGTSTGVSVDDSQLAKARPVQEDDLETAQPVRLQDLNTGTSNSPLKEVLQKGAILLILVSVALGIVILVVLLLRGDSDDTTLVPLHQDDTLTISPTGYSQDSHIMSLLPEYTVREIQQKPDSPQALALDWILSEKSLSNYTDERIIQRYSLAALFYATNGPSSWVYNSGWLSDSHECTWDMSAAAFEGYFGYQFYSPCLLDGTNASGPGEVYQYLHLEGNGLRGTLPEELYLLSNLRDLNMGLNNGLEGTLSTRVGQLTGLQVLSFATSPISGTIPTQISQTAVSFLYLFNCRLEGSIPSELGLLSSLIEVDLAEQLLSSSIPSELGLLHQNLEVLFIGDQGLTGEIPNELGSLTALKEFGLSNNLLTGTLSSELGLLRKAHYFSTAGNQISSSIPSEFGLLSSLIQLDLSSNHLSSTLPVELGQLAAMPPIKSYDSYHFNPPREAGKLVRLRLAENNLSGPLPSQIGLLTHLELIDLHENLLSSAIPSEFGLLSNLTTLNLANNSLSGTVDESLCFFSSVAFDCSSDFCGCNCTCESI
ncbi:Leucine Rich Repeat [Seminavis robusta]|uniref:Leucine Rich Repeat n=1 Tax=Seminavis robusta TaxID=568900 RepID=A0A9N8H604_9STRA|nr:Leucine Rich Repeat [Seminavis robusta]|eukprot:Sro100_g051080.1 Leucine Rich Repeat (737) ;mRNA; f:3224-5543